VPGDGRRATTIMRCGQAGQLTWACRRAAAGGAAPGSDDRSGGTECLTASGYPRLARPRRLAASPGSDPVAGQRAANQVPHIPANRREKAAIVAVANDPSPPDAAARFLDGAEPLTRVGTAAAARILAESGDARAWTALLARAAADDDLTVRLAAGAGQAPAGPAVFRTCRNCAQPNDIDAGRCSGCKKDIALR